MHLSVVFRLGTDEVYTSTLLLSFRHGFATRAANGWPGDYIGIKQVHSATVVAADGDLPSGTSGDALIRSAAGSWIGIRTADCVPVLLADPARRTVAAVHAGWRGTVAGICQAAVAQMHSVYGCDPRSLVAAVGPCIGVCCYEVGQEVLDALASWYTPPAQGRRVDLAEANRRQLIASGLSPENIDVSGFCTACDSSRFESYRRDGDQSGRMVAAIRPD